MTILPTVFDMDNSPENVAYYTLAPDFECLQDTPCFENPSQGVETTLFIVLSDDEDYAEQMEVIYTAYLKLLIGRQDDYFAYEIFWQNQFAYMDTFTPQELIFHDQHGENNRLDTINLMIKSYGQVCDGKTASDRQLVIIHDNEENSEDILRRLEEEKLIGSVVFLLSESQNQLEESHTHEEPVEDHAIDSYDDPYADEYVPQPTSGPITTSTQAPKAETKSPTEPPTPPSTDAAVTDSGYGYVDSRDNYDDITGSMSNWYRRRRRRSANGVQVIENWTSESKRVPLINSLCQIARQSEEIIEGLCQETTTTAEPVIVTDPTSDKAFKQIKNNILDGTCEVNFAPTLCSERELEIVFIVEATTEYNNLEQVFNQLLVAVEAVEKSRFSLFLNEKVLLISLDLAKFISELKKIDTSTVSTGSMNWSNVQEKAKIMLDPNADHDTLFETEEDDLPESTNDLTNGTNNLDESNYTTDYDPYATDYDPYATDADSYYGRRRKRSTPDDVVGFENLAEFAKNSPVFVALPVNGGADPDNFGEEIKVLVFEMGVRFKKSSYKHILLETGDQFACNFVKTICPLEVDQIEENVAELVTVVKKLPDTSRTLSCFADLDILSHGSGTICRTEVKDSSKPLELVFVVEVIDATNLAAILDEVFIMTARFGNGVDAYRVSIMFNNKLIALSLTFDQLEEQFSALKSIEVDTTIEMDWEMAISDLYSFIGGDIYAFVDGGDDDWSAYNSDYNYADTGYGGYGVRSTDGDSFGMKTFGDYGDSYYGRRRRSADENADAGLIGIENYGEFEMNPKYIIALPQIGGVGPVTQTGDGLTALPKIFQDLMKDEEAKHGEQWIRFVWFEYGSDFHGIDASQHILLYSNGQSSLTCGAREFVCEFTRLHQLVIPDPLDLPPPPICIGGKANIVIMIDEDFERADQMKQFAEQFGKSFPVTRGSEISIMTYGKNGVRDDGISVDNVEVALSTADATLAMMGGSGESVIIFMNSQKYNQAKPTKSSRTISRPNVFFLNINNEDLSGIKKWSSMLSDRAFELIDISAYGQDTIEEFGQAISDVLENICTSAGGSYPGGSGDCSGSASEYIAPPCFIPDQIALHFVVDMSASVKSFMLSYYKEIFDQILTSFSEMFPDRVKYVKVSTAQGRSASKVKVQEIIKSNDIEEIQKAKSELLRSRRGTVRLEFLTEELKKTQNENEITIILSSTGRELQGRIHPDALPNTLLIINREDQYNAIAASYDPSQLLLDTSYSNLHEVITTIQKFICNTAGGIEFEPVLKDTCYYISDEVRDLKGKIIDGELMSFGYENHDRVGCAVRTCNNRNIQEYCLKECANDVICETNEEAVFDPSSCSWSCASKGGTGCDSIKCINKGPRCPRGMRLASMKSSCCPFDDPEGFTCECDEGPTCPPGYISNTDPATGCKLPCEAVNICPPFDVAACEADGGIVEKAGPCSYCGMPEIICDEAICPETAEPVCDDCSVIDGEPISFTDTDGEWISNINEKVCRGSCESNTKYGESVCSICAPSDDFDKEIIEMTNAETGAKQKYTVSQVSSCKCQVVDCSNGFIAPEPTPNVGSSDEYNDDYQSTFDDDNDSIYNYN